MAPGKQPLRKKPKIISMKRVKKTIGAKPTTSKQIILDPIIPAGTELSSLNLHIFQPKIEINFKQERGIIKAFLEDLEVKKEAERLEKLKTEAIEKAKVAEAAKKAKAAMKMSKAKLAKAKSEKAKTSQNQTTVKPKEENKHQIKNIRVFVPEDFDTSDITTKMISDAFAAAGQSSNIRVLKPQIVIDIPKEEETICQYAQSQKKVKMGIPALTEVRETPDKGAGLFAAQVIKKDDFIVEYSGEVISSKLFDDRTKTIYAGQYNHCGFDLGNGFVIDGNSEAGGNYSRYINHSCNPNTEVYPISEFRIAMYAKRRINNDEEITIDYRFTKPIPCRCKEEGCNGIICEIRFGNST